MGPLSYNYQPTGVIYGFIKKVFDLLVHFNTTDIIFLWDARKNYRSDYFPEYKKKRKELRDQLELEQIEEYQMLFDQMVMLHHEILPSIGFNNTFVFHGFEADDLIAYILKYKNNTKKRKIIVSNDNDLFQLLDLADMYLFTSEKIFRKKEFLKKYKIPVSLWVKAKCIGGCDSDEVPGIFGVADPKKPTSKALSYIRGELVKGKIYSRINSYEGRQTMLRNKKLIKLPYRNRQQQVPPFDLYEDNVTIRKIVRTFTKYGFQSLCQEDYLGPIRKLFKE